MGTCGVYIFVWSVYKLENSLFYLCDEILNDCLHLTVPESLVLLGSHSPPPFLILLSGLCFWFVVTLLLQTLALLNLHMRLATSIFPTGLEVRPPS